MKLSDVFNQLAYGELSQLGIIDQETGLIALAKYPMLVAHVNLGLSALYKRFPLKEGRLTFELQPGKITYVLNTSEDVLFVESNGADEFADDILKVERVYTDKGVELGLNNLSDEYGCTTPSSTVLRVPLAISNQAVGLPSDLVTQNLEVVYRANHPTIVYSAPFNPSRVNVELPITHLEPLLLFVASRVNNPIGMTNEFHAGNSYAAKYEKACVELEIKNLNVDQGSNSSKLVANGWV